MQWLNENSREKVNLFALRLEVWKIGESDPAVRLNPVVEPSEWKERAQRSEDEFTDTEKLREEFWTAFRDLIEEHDTPLSARKPFADYYYNNPIGKSGFELQFTIKVTENELGSGLLIRDDADAYWSLLEEQEKINAQFNQEVIWNEPEETRSGKKRSKIMVTKHTDVTDQNQWEDHLEWMLETGEVFHEVFYDRLQQL
jgi:hypothetical protein